MTLPKALGQVSSLFPHVKPDWWREAYNHIYLWADGDCVESPVVTDAECNALIQIPRVQALLNSISSMKVLDLCCGQGRHTINLAQRFPSAGFLGVDQSTYLLDIARKRVEEAQKVDGEIASNIKFKVGDARQIPAADGMYGLVILLGNSFGHGSCDDDLQMLREVYRILRPGGTFVIDYVDGAWMRENFTPSGWEWLGQESHFLSGSDSEKQLLVLRERELSADAKRLASREIVIDLQNPPTVHQDLFYAVQLYDIPEMEELLCKAGLHIQIYESSPVTALSDNSQMAADMGMMEHRQLVTAVKPDPFDPQDVDTYIHPSLVQAYDPQKGRLLRMDAPVHAGTVIIADVPYSLVPAMSPGSNNAPALICSNLSCRRRVPRDSLLATRCTKNCFQDVIWCDDSCKSIDQARHGLECSWLKKHGAQILQEEGEDDLAMLWIIVRMLAGRHIESELKVKPEPREQDAIPYPWSNRFKRGYQTMEAMRGNQDLWPQERITRWKDLIQKYLSNQETGAVANVSNIEILSLICKEEANSFGLYPGHTGSPECLNEKRGPQYGLGCYPHATICNHSCSPNLKHGPDEQGRMVLTSTRDIAAGEECCIAYFDLTVHVNLQARRKRTRELFTFSCTCERCLREEKEEEGATR
ncbi:S-adenosyl-L-methionine-dependent methyltransferase [Aspergillus keveii]|uniref:S-adenosyl-L-methionine-dependent methyltransferase n=1 Tax=Aspergillus keveii TaxID=714993 RepID=A0ABR4GGU6_9EURO